MSAIESPQWISTISTTEHNTRLHISNVTNIFAKLRKTKPTLQPSKIKNSKLYMKLLAPVLNELVQSLSEWICLIDAAVWVYGHLDAGLMMSAVQPGRGQVLRERQVRRDYSVHRELGQQPSKLSKPPGLVLPGIRGISNSCEHSRLKNQERVPVPRVYDLSLRDHMRLIDTSLEAVVLGKRCQLWQS